MMISYDYQDLIDELKEEINDKELSLMDTVQVLRGPTIEDGYKPVIDWFYNHAKMETLLRKYFYDTPAVMEELDQLKKHYDDNRPYLEEVPLADLFSELEAVNEVIK